MKLSLLISRGRWTAADGFSLLGLLCMMNMLLFVLYWAGVWDGSTDGTKQFTQSNGIGQWQTNPWSNTLQFPDRTTAADNAALLDEVGNF